MCGINSCSCYEGQLRGGFLFRRGPGIFKMYTVIREKFERIVAENDLLDETVVIRAKPLTPEEAI